MSAYRDTSLLLRRRAEALRARAELTAALPSLHRVYARRWSRAVGGGVGTFGALCVAALALANALGSPGFPLETLTQLLLGSVVAAVGAALAARAAFSLYRSGFSRLAALPELQGELAADLGRLDAANPWPEKERALGRLELASTALPLIAASLLAPLTLHWIVATVSGAHNYGDWILISLAIVGHAHLVLALMSGLYARKLRKTSTEDLAVAPVHRPWIWALGITVLAAAIPGAILLLVPPLLTLVTGALFIPAAFLWIRHRVVQERLAMGAAEAATSRVRVDADEIEPTLEAAPEEPRIDAAARADAAAHAAEVEAEVEAGARAPGSRRAALAIS
ncbi:MAG: hypothetical protein JNL38_06495 [Myxococcales bacterium]|nr:hypothetical protein [Myxococcales bacterium]